MADSDRTVLDIVVEAIATTYRELVLNENIKNAFDKKGSLVQQTEKCEVRVYHGKAQKILLQHVLGEGDSIENYLTTITAAKGIRLKESGAKGGEGFAFLGPDRLYMLKTVNKAEKRALKGAFPDYRAYACGENKDSLLPRFLGFFRWVHGGTRRYGVIFYNVFHSMPSSPVAMFDLKGSVVHRLTLTKLTETKLLPMLESVEDPFQFLASHPKHVFLDADLLALGIRFRVHASHWNALEAAARRDSDFLKKFNFMDYSLLVGVGDISPDAVGGADDLLASHEGWWRLPAELVQREGKLDGKPDLDYCENIGDLRCCGYAMLYVGIIDILQIYNSGKKAAHAFKSIYHDGSALSTVPASQYQVRFVEMCRRAVVKSE